MASTKPRRAAPPSARYCDHGTRGCTPGDPQSWCLYHADEAAGRGRMAIAAVKSANREATGEREPREPRRGPAPSHAAPLPFDGEHQAAHRWAVRRLAIGIASDTDDLLQRRLVLARAAPYSDQPSTFVARALRVSWPPTSAVVPGIDRDNPAHVRAATILMSPRILATLRGFVTRQVRGHFRPGTFALTEEGMRRLYEAARACDGLACNYIPDLVRSGFLSREPGTGRRQAIAEMLPLLSEQQIARAIAVVEGRPQIAAGWAAYDAGNELERTGWNTRHRRAGRGRPRKTGKA